MVLGRTSHPLTFTVFVCPEHGLLSDREAQDVIQGHDGTMFGRHPDGDGYTEDYYCPISDRRWNGGAFVGTDCMKPLTEYTLTEAER